MSEVAVSHSSREFVGAPDKLALAPESPKKSLNSFQIDRQKFAKKGTSSSRVESS